MDPAYAPYAKDWYHLGDMTAYVNGAGVCSDTDQGLID